MASTGQQITYNGNFYLKIRWDITSQSVANNRSGVRVRMYIGANSGWSLSDSSNSWTLGVASSSFSGSNVSVSINGSEKLLADEQVFVDHNSDGTKNIAINGSVSGFYFGGINPASFTATLDAIPRASTSSSSASWTATDNLSVGISRADSSFTHTVRVYVGSTLVGTNTGVTTSTSFNSTAFHTNVVTAMGSSSSATARYEIDTFSGSSKIGSTYSRSGTVTAPSMSTISVPSSFDVGSTLNFTISRDNTEFSHKVELFWGATAIATDVELKNSISASLATSGLYSRITTSNSGTVTIRITTYYGDTQNSNTQIRTHINYTATARIVNSDPTPPTTLTYAISGYTAITGNTTNVIVQGKTSVSVTFNAGSARNSATITGYNIKVNGRQDLPVGASGTHSLGVLNTSGSGSIVVEIIDSRGNKASISTPITVIPYQSPAQSSIIRRDDGFGTASTLTVKGIMSDVKVSAVRKNYIKSIQYRVKTSPATTFPTTYTPINVGTNGASVTYDNAGGFTIAHALTLADDKSHEIEVVVVDAFDGQSSTTQGKNLSLSTGKPLFWLDTNRLSVGVNAFPAINDTFEVGGAGIRSTALTVTGSTTLNSLTATGTVNLGYNSANINAHNAGKIAGNLTHSGDYFNIRSYSSASYGAGQAEIWYSDTDNRIRFASRSDSNGAIRGTKLSAVTIETNAIVLDSASQLDLPSTKISTLNVTTGYTGGGSVTLTGATAGFTGYAFIGTGTNLLLRTAGEVRAVMPDDPGSYRPVRGSSFPTSSSINYKTNLENIDERIDALALINETDVWHYHLKGNVDSFIFDKPKIGVIAEMVNPLIRDEDGVDPYSMLSVSWRAIQQLHDLIDKQSVRIRDLERVLGVIIDEESNV